MIVTEIRELSQKKSKIYIDNEFAFVLYKGEIRKYGIRKDESISEEIYNIIHNEVLIKRAKLRCMNLLKSRDYTTLQLKNKLKEGLYPEEIIQTAIDYVKSYKYLDDERYAQQYISYQIQYKSRKKIEISLIQKGISKEIIEQTFEDLQEEGLYPDEEKKIEDILRKKGYTSDKIDDFSEKEKGKIVAFLYRKGFALDTIYSVMKHSF